MSIARVAAAIVLSAATGVSAAAQEAVRVCFEDALTGAPVSGVTVVRDSGALRLLATACATIPNGTMTLRRLGYRSVTANITSESTIRLHPVLAPAAALLDTQQVVAVRDMQHSRVVETLAVADARRRGASDIAQLVQLIPFVQSRSARGELGLSLRGARREQMVVTLDGMQLNDPATGLADAAPLPLASLDAASLSLGASPVQHGSGAIGGVLALRSSTKPVIAVRTGSWGEYAAELAAGTSTDRVLLTGGASFRTAQNDFEFRNTVVPDAAHLETRVNNDERHASVFGSVRSADYQVLAVATDIERGMVGPMNVRTYDRDRAHTQRVFVRAATQVGAVQVSSALRAFHLAYRDPARPVFDSDARARAADLEVAWRQGAVVTTATIGGDAVRASGDVAQERFRGAFAVATTLTMSGVQVDLGARTDAVSGAGVVPSFTASLQRRWGQVASEFGQVRARMHAAQALRAPTLYDLYFSSPQRVSVRPLRPERVRHDLELGLAFERQSPRTTSGNGHASLLLDAAVVSRTVQDAIVWFPGNFMWSPSNVGEERLRGVEARAHVQLGRLSGGTWGTWYDPVLHSGALRIPTPYVARHAGGATASIAVTRALSLNGAMRVMGARPFTAGPRSPDFELPAVSIGDVSLTFASHVQRRRLLTSFAIDNVGNVTWQSVRGFPAPGRRWVLSFTIENSPR